MYSVAELDEYMAEIRKHVCSCCIERPSGGPPCAPHGKVCGVESNLSQIIDVAHATRSRAMDVYIERFHGDVCPHCVNRESPQCPCPLDALLLLAIEAIDAVDERHGRYAVA